MKKPTNTGCAKLTIPVWGLLCMMFLSAGCSTITLIAPYDDQLDKDITTLQVTTETFLVKIERSGKSSPEDYTKNWTDFYDKVKVALSGLEVRAGAVAKNELTLQELGGLETEIAQMEERHKSKGLSGIDAIEFEESINRRFRAILTLEVAKKGITSTSTTAK